MILLIVFVHVAFMIQGVGQAIHLLAVSEDGKWLVSANSDHEVVVYNLKKKKVIICDVFL